MFRLISLSLGIASLALIAGCSAYVGDYQYMPRPVLAEIPSTQPQQTPPFAVLVSIIGIRRADPKQNLPLSVELRVRVDNNTQLPAAFDWRSLSLTNGELLTFGPPILQVPPSTELAPMQRAIITAWFPFPPGRSTDTSDMDSFQLSWNATVEDRDVRQVVYFRRVIPIYYGPYYYPPEPFFGSTVIVHHHHH